MKDYWKGHCMLRYGEFSVVIINVSVVVVVVVVVVGLFSFKAVNWQLIVIQCI
jgi:hypothetical protein